LKRIKANLSQLEMAVKAGVSVRKVKAWEHDQIIEFNQCPATCVPCSSFVFLNKSFQSIIE
jgi:hypothetical protein